MGRRSIARRAAADLKRDVALRRGASSTAGASLRRPMEIRRPTPGNRPLPGLSTRSTGATGARGGPRAGKLFRAGGATRTRGKVLLGAAGVRLQRRRFSPDISEGTPPHELRSSHDPTVDSAASGAASLIHSHIPVQHLIRQLDDLRARRGQRDPRPAWVTSFIDEIAECFDPHTDVGRVGFECRPDGAVWTVTLYLGRTEVVGGAEDGIVRPTSFDFDVALAVKRFDDVQNLQWTACPDPWTEGGSDGNSQLAIEGLVKGQPLRLLVTSVPPEEAGPAFKQYPDGRCAPV